MDGAALVDTNRKAFFNGLNVTNTANDGVIFTTTHTSANSTFTGVKIDHKRKRQHRFDWQIASYMALEITADSLAVAGGDTANEYRLFCSAYEG